MLQTRFIPGRSAVVILAAAACFIALVSFKAHQSPAGQLLLMLLTPLYLGCVAASLIEPFRGWRPYGFRTLLPLIACIAAWYGAFPVGAFLQSRLFMHNLPRFEAIIADIDKRPLPADGTAATIPIADSDKRQILHLQAQRDANGALIVEFGTERGFPVMHSGWIYSSSGVLPTDARFHYRWPDADEVRPHWFRVSN